jgi:hypothetical protein
MPTKIRNISSMSAQTQMEISPERFGATDISKLLVPVSELPDPMGRGRQRSSVAAQFYGYLLENMNTPFRVVTPFASRKEAENFSQNLRTRSYNDGLNYSHRIVQDPNKANSWNLFVLITR